MPDVSQKQHNLMEMVAHDPEAAKRVGIPQSVGEEFVHADQAEGKFRSDPHHAKAHARGFTAEPAE